MPSQGRLKTSSTEQLNEAVIINELERRYYLYVVGGDYEKLFYVFESAGKNEEGQSFEQMTRVKLDVEVPEADRKYQTEKNSADPVYKHMLDYMLKQRIHNKLERDSVLETCQELATLKPIWQGFCSNTTFGPDLFDFIDEHTWLKGRLTTISKSPQFIKMLNLSPSKSLQDNLETIGYPLFIWLLPRVCGESIYEHLHPSIRPVFSRLRHYSRFLSGALGTLAVNGNVKNEEKWIIYMLGAISMVPNAILINTINTELCNLIEQQKKAVAGTPDEEQKLKVLSNFEFSGEILRDVLSMDEFIKPQLLEELELKHFDPSPYILGFSEETSHISTIYFQARAYAIYRQLYRTGRIHAKETAVFLKKYKINKRILFMLNETDFTDVQAHVDLHKKLLGD